MHCDLYLRVDLRDPFGSDVHLVLTDRFTRGVDLPVDVRQTDLVVVDQIDRADPGPDKRFDRIAADAADAENRHACVPQLLHGFAAEQKLGSGILIEHFIVSRTIIIALNLIMSIDLICY